MCNTRTNRRTSCVSLWLLASLLSWLVTPLYPALAQSGDEAALQTMVNDFRTSKGLNVLTWNGQLAAAAYAHAKYLGDTTYTDPHRESNGSLPQDRAAAQGYQGRASENVVGGMASRATLEWAWNWWMNSPVHVNNMLGNWNEIGVAIYEGHYGRWYTIVFGLSGAAPFVRKTPGAGGSSGVSAVRPTRIPITDTPVPTYTPSITLTPSVTFTPRATFTPTDTPTWLPPSMTPIVFDLTPQGAMPSMTPVPIESTPIVVNSSTTSPTVIAINVTAPPVNVANNAATAPPAELSSSNPIRGFIPIMLFGAMVLFGLLGLRNFWQRSQ